MPAAKERPAGKGRRVCSLQDSVATGVYEWSLGAGEIPPEHKDYAITFI